MPVIRAGLGFDGPSLAGAWRLWIAFYFSVVTFTTLGYGDYVPGSVAGQVFAGAEALLGVFVMSLFLVCFVRKFSR